MFKKIIYCALFAVGLWFVYICTQIAMHWLFINHCIALSVWLIEEPIMELACMGWWICFVITEFSK